MATVTATATYTKVDIENVVRRLKADFVMIAASTGAWSEKEANDYAHDIEVLATNGYLASVDLTLMDGSTEYKAVQYHVNTDAAGITGSRPGGVVWPKIFGATLRIIVFHTSAYDAAAQQKAAGRLRKSWTNTTVDTTHSTLSAGGGRDYASNAYGLTRKDWGK